MFWGKNHFEESQQTTTKAWKITQHAKSLCHDLVIYIEIRNESVLYSPRHGIFVVVEYLVFNNISPKGLLFGHFTDPFFC